MIADREERYCPRKTRKDAKGREDRAREIHERTRKKKDSFFTFLIFRVFRGQSLLFFVYFACFAGNVSYFYSSSLSCVSWACFFIRNRGRGIFGVRAFGRPGRRRRSGRRVWGWGLCRLHR